MIMADAPTYVSKTKGPIPRPNFIPTQQSWLAYQWIDKDPELDLIVAYIAESGKSAEWIERECEKNGHKVSRWTILNWSYGATKRPQNASISSVMAAIGYNKTWTYTG